MAVSKSQQKAVHKYVKANYDRMKLTVPKGQKGTIKAHATADGENVNSFIGRAITETIARDGASGPQEAVGQPVGAGVREYWIVNPEDQTIQVMLLDGDGVLQLHEIYDRRGVAKVNVLDGCFIELEKVFSE